jgi:predicted phosphoribosyltransferase
MFRDRREAGERLAEALAGRVTPPAVVLGIPRGGVLVAAPVAHALGAQLDVVVTKKIGAPGHEELGIGAVAPGVLVLDEDLVSRLRIAPDALEAATRDARDEVERRALAFRRAGGKAAELAGATAVLVDDGIATGGTVHAAIAWARASGASRVVVAAPVAPPDVVADLSRSADDVVVLAAPADFRAVGAWYDDFTQTTDGEVRAALQAAEH